MREQSKSLLKRALTIGLNLTKLSSSEDTFIELVEEAVYARLFVRHREEYLKKVHDLYWTLQVGKPTDPMWH